MTLRKEIGMSLQKARKAAGFKSARAFAENMMYNANTYTDWEQGRHTFTVEQACEMADALGCTLDELAGRETSAPALSPRERAVVDAYRHEDATGRAAIERVCGIKSGEGGPVSREVA